ncbi:hypothetical protein EVAR_4047_1 [Eumeta japonica]|uniref:Uncharacterized protein n=1 Tax=Eumeta variegata TaxID=151549 RepID=A0A4C1T4Z1_EUMVA|nr:hypothetical protein EVAR_4047_1 [Eumeta japonica]
MLSRNTITLQDYRNSGVRGENALAESLPPAWTYNEHVHRIFFISIYLTFDSIPISLLNPIPVIILIPDSDPGPALYSVPRSAFIRDSATLPIPVRRKPGVIVVNWGYLTRSCGTKKRHVHKGDTWPALLALCACLRRTNHALPNQTRVAIAPLPLRHHATTTNIFILCHDSARVEYDALGRTQNPIN